MKLRIEYFDQNERFAPLLPREGAVVARPKCADSELAWHLVQLDEPVLYESEESWRLLLASRWKGEAVGGPARTSVFLLWVPPVAEVRDGFRLADFRHVAWGMVQEIGEGNEPALERGA